MKVQSASVAPRARAETSRSLAAALGAGDLAAAAACFARDGCLITPDATAVHGRDRIRPVLAQMIFLRTRIEVEMNSAVRAGDVVLGRERWALRTGDFASTRPAETLHPLLVLRYLEGTWKLAIAAPWLSGGAGR